MERPLRILLGSLKHVTAGKHSAFMPTAIGFLASYTEATLGKDKVEFVLSDDAEFFLEKIESWKPDVIGLSHYCWNAELNYRIMRFAKEKMDNIVCIAGGPEFHDTDNECLDLLKAHPEIDFFAYGEGEVPFSTLVEKINNNNSLEDLKSEPQLGFMAVHPETDLLVTGERPMRNKDMDFIPSPYLSGHMDTFFDGNSAPMVQLARGCPYFCTFCNAAQSWYNRVAAFSIERVKDELEYIAKKVSDSPNLPLAITDSNFGMFKRDIDIAHHIRDLQDKYGWPVSFDFTTGKSQYERILNVNEILRNTSHILTALQSTNEETLDTVKRKNLKQEKFKELHGEIKKRGMKAAADLIIPLPHETKESFMDGLEMIADEGVDLIVSNTLCLLKGTELNNHQTRKTHGMKSKWRLVARQYGEYATEKCFETEEVCIETNTMSFSDYLECRGVGGVTIIYSDPQFDVIHRHVKELRISKFGVIRKIWERLSSGQSAVSPLYKTFLEQSESELFDSHEEVCSYYSKPKIYEQLKLGLVGDNLIRRFRGGIFLDVASEALELAYNCLEEVARESGSSDKDIAAMQDAKEWCLKVRNVSRVFSQKQIKFYTERVDLNFDINDWYQHGAEGEKLVIFEKPVSYRMEVNIDKVAPILDAGYQMYGDDRTLTVPRILEYHNISNFWLETSTV